MVQQADIGVFGVALVFGRVGVPAALAADRHQADDAGVDMGALGKALRAAAAQTALALLQHMGLDDGGEKVRVDGLRPARGLCHGLAHRPTPASASPRQPKPLRVFSPSPACQAKRKSASAPANTSGALRAMT